MEFLKSRRHHCEVGEQIALSQDRPEGNHRLRKVATRSNHLVKAFLGLRPPEPRVLESLDLLLGLGARFVTEEYIVVLAALERGVEIDQVDRLVTDVPAQYVEVVPIEKLVQVIAMV